MPKIYENSDKTSPVESIIIKKYPGYPFIYECPRVKLSPGVSREELEKSLPIKLLTLSEVTQDKDIPKEEESLYFIQHENRFSYTLISLIKKLQELNMINNAFYSSIYDKEAKSYFERKVIENKRATFLPHENDKSLIRAFILQQHGYNIAAFIRIDPNDEDRIRSLLDNANVGWDSMFSEFENHWVLFSPKGTAGPLSLLNRLENGGLVSSEFRDMIFSQASRVLSETHSQEPRYVGYIAEDLYKRSYELTRTVNEYVLASKRVKHGSFQGSLGRHLREIDLMMKKIQAKEIAAGEGYKEIIKHAKELGNNHPILLAANKCYALFNEMVSQDSLEYKQAQQFIKM